jgi:hypothetical protein
VFRRVFRAVVPLAAAGALTAITGLSQAATTPGWRIVGALPNNSMMTGLAATGAGNAWAAGTVCANASCTRSTLLVRRWNGKAWTVIPVPKAYVNSSAEGGVVAVAATSAANAWIFNTPTPQVTAVGSGGQGRAALTAGPARAILHAAGTTQAGPTVVLHWTGKGWGATVKLPADVATAVAPSAKDAWAFGVSSASASSIGAYAAHYDGRRWSPVRVPVVGIRASATSTSNIWVAGISPASSPTMPAAAIMNFNGKAWRATPVPSLGLTAKQIAIPTGIAAVSAKNVWAAGQILDTSSTTNPVMKPFLLHWNGGKWAVVKIPYTGVVAAESLAQDGHGGVWMSVLSLTNNGIFSHIWHYTNGAWSRIGTPARKGEITILDGLAWIPGTRSVWGTGEELPTGPSPAPGFPSVILKYGA